MRSFIAVAAGAAVAANKVPGIRAAIIPTGPDGKPFTRPGRATFILAHRDGRWQCVHSHVSLQPTQSESAHGRLSA